MSNLNDGAAEEESAVIGGDAPIGPEDRFVEALAEYDEALRAGRAPLVAERLSNEFGDDAKQARAILELLEQVWPRAQSTSTPRDGPEPPTQAAPQAAPDPNRLGRFDIRRELGRGGFGVVYLAYDPLLDRQVALKVPRPDLIASSNPQQRFLREARAAASLSHPNICSVHEVGEESGRHYIAMAFVDGRPLTDAIKTGQFRAERAAASLMHKLALALQVAHERGVVHRDLKPSNILIRPDGEPMITDFGLAARQCDANERLTEYGTLLGTPVYMPPEQISGDIDSVGPSADIYSLGVILYEVLTRRLPFEGDRVTLPFKIVHEEPASLLSLRPDLDPRLQAICQKAMAKAIADRYTTAAEFARSLQGFLDGGQREGQPAATTVWQVESPDRVRASPRRAHTWTAIGVIAVALFVAGYFIRVAQNNDGGSGTTTITVNSPAPFVLTIGPKADRIELAPLSPDGEAGPARHDAAPKNSGQADKNAPASKTGQTNAAAPGRLNASGAWAGRMSLEVHVQHAWERGGYRVMASDNLPLLRKDRVHLKAVLGREAYPYLYWYDAAGKAYRLWPKEPARQEKARVVWYPPLDPTGLRQQWIEVVGEPGTELILLASSENPLSKQALETFETVPVRLASAEVVGAAPQYRLIPLGSAVDGSSERAPGPTVLSAKGREKFLSDAMDGELGSRFDAYVGLIFPLK